MKCPTTCTRMKLSRAHIDRNGCDADAGDIKRRRQAGGPSLCKQPAIKAAHQEVVMHDPELNPRAAPPTPPPAANVRPKRQVIKFVCSTCQSRYDVLYCSPLSWEGGTIPTLKCRKCCPPEWVNISRADFERCMN